MKTTEIIGMSVFGLLFVAALAFAIWQGARQRERVARYSSDRGWTILKTGDAGLSRLLEEMTPDLSWTLNPIMLVGVPPLSVYLFGFQESTKGRGHQGSSTGYACLAERAATQPEQAVTIDVRVPLLDKLVRDRVETGGEEFRREFTVSCRDAAAAYGAVNPDVQRILLGHITERQWNISVTVARRAVLVRSHWAQAESEWDYLIDLTKKLRAAVR